jgi:hypothetical protein
MGLGINPAQSHNQTPHAFDNIFGGSKEETNKKQTRVHAFFGVAFFGVAFFAAAAFFGAAFLAAFLAVCGAVVLVTRPDLVFPSVTAGFSSTAGAYW